MSEFSEQYAELNKTNILKDLINRFIFLRLSNINNIW